MNTRKRCNGAPWRMTNPSLDDLLVEHAALDCRRILSLSMAVSSKGGSGSFLGEGNTVNCNYGSSFCCDPFCKVARNSFRSSA
jgi:hypothetical protein